ncbi:MerR family transcriptional regulator [Streptomyces candidus]|uniref:DNA-binding transcriptional MerR regulator n=1 Tax=Streptomyces candidus TaxID=67283 RepID=A0A7X0HHU3_9ACTN|nr:MerR family transcriptional regulator [Streptomyces candidus]MBB6437916.1 DNA-binding transcriptional MerR regulator [Streptomyces candidus]GHH49752.1 transcriptional regulator [Streptomyces candidus]
MNGNPTGPRGAEEDGRHRGSSSAGGVRDRRPDGAQQLSGRYRAAAGAGTAGLTTGAVARRLGVAPTTLRSWDRRYGIGPAVRDDGRHRRWTADDVALLERMCALTARGVPPADAARLARDPGGDTDPGTPPPARPAPTAAHPAVRTTPPPGTRALPVPGPRTSPDAGVPARTVRGLRNAAVRLDSPTLDQLLADAVHTHGLVGSWHEAMAPALRAIGRTWANSGDAAGERYVEAEHLLSWHISTALRRSGAAKDSGDDERPVLLACLPGEMHTLALESLTAALSERGLPTRMFGAAVPLGALSEAIRRTGPRAVVLWSQTRPTADRSVIGLVRSTSQGIRGARTQPMVLAAGPGWARTAPFEGVHRPRDLAGAIRLVEAAPYA